MNSDKIKWIIFFLIFNCLISTINAQEKTWKHSFERKTDALFASNATFSSNGKWLAFGTREGSVKVFDIETEKQIVEFKEHKGIAVWVAFSSNDSLLVSVGKDGMLQIYDMIKLKKIKSIQAHSKSINSVGFSAGDFQVYTASRDNSVKIWDVKTGNLIKEITDTKGNVRSVVFSPDGKYVICATSALMKGIRYYEWNTGKEVKILNAPNSIAITINPDETVLASASLHKEIFLWDIEKGKIKDSLIGHADFVKSVSFSPGGRYMVSGSDDKTVKIWDVKNKKLLHTFNGHTNLVIHVEYSPDGTKVLSSSWDGTIKIWDLIPLKLEPEDIYIKPKNDKLPPEDAQILKTTFENLLFETNKAVIKSESFSSLDALAKLMQKKPNYHLIISGHTDNVGDATYNYHLSIQRAEAVAKYLTDKKIDAFRIKAQGFGATKPIADNTTAEGRAQNRRVEFNLYSIK